MQFQDEAGFAAALARAPLPAAILVAGAEELRVIEAADAVRAKAREGGSERSVYHVDGRFDWDELVGDFSAMSLFSSARLLDVRTPDGKFGKEGGEAIAAFCKDPPPGTTLLVSCLEWSKRHAETTWAKAIAKAGHVLAMWPLPRHKLADWLLRRLIAHGIDASHEAAELLSERVEGNLLAAAQEVEKLSLLVDRKQRIDLAQMQRLVADSSRYDVFKLTDACMEGDAARAVRILRALRAEGDAVPALLGPLVQQIMQVAGLAAEAARGGDLRAAMAAQRIWDAKQAVFRRALERHDARGWEAFTIELGRIDRMAKGREAGDPWIALERLLAAIAAARGRRLLVA
ncbi:MAG: DNA polymerase III subunit delta [Proteobacteria bacterium]|nr:DNA polymerase III subunit delta [Pseudomonadota bacterium]